MGSPLSFGFNASANKSKTTRDSTGTFNNTTTPLVPDWAAGPVQTAAGRVGSLLNLNPADTVAPAHSLQLRGAADSADLGGYDGNFGMATDVTRGAADTSWLQPHLNANTPFASGGKAY